MVKKILVPVDGSPTAFKALKFAADLARQTGSELEVLFVVEQDVKIVQSVPAAAAPTHLQEPVEDYLMQAADALLDEAEAVCGKGVTVSKKVRSGEPVREIVSEAQRFNADLIVTGSHGKTGLEAVLLGSVTSGILREDAKHPVVVVRKGG